MKEESIMKSINLWGTIGGFVAVLLMFPYISSEVRDAVDEKEEAAIQREQARDVVNTALFTSFKDEVRDEMIITLDTTSSASAIKKVLYRWEQDFTEKRLPLELEEQSNSLIQNHLMLEIPVTRFDKDGVAHDAGIEYYVKVNGKYKKIKVEK